MAKSMAHYPPGVKPPCGLGQPVHPTKFICNPAVLNIGDTGKHILGDWAWFSIIDVDFKSITFNQPDRGNHSSGSACKNLHDVPTRNTFTHLLEGDFPFVNLPPLGAGKLNNR